MSNQPEIGKGIFTTKDVATILKMQYRLAHRWITTYWKTASMANDMDGYSWEVDGSLAVDFQTLVELAVVCQLLKAGVKPKKIVDARKVLIKQFRTPAPFANKHVLEGIQTDKKQIFFKHNGDVVTLDATTQFNLTYVNEFLTNLDFDEELVAKRLWPRGRGSVVVVDPLHKFGHPVLDGRNIYPETIYQYYRAGETEVFISELFGLDPKEVTDAIDYCKAA